MGLFDELAGKMLGALGGTEGEQSGLLKGVTELLDNKETGGLAGLVQSFKEQGLGDIVSSWIGTGDNLPISADQLQQGLGLDRLQQLADNAGLSLEDVKSRLTELLPGVIDKLTPEGMIPERGLLEKGLNFLKERL